MPLSDDLYLRLRDLLLARLGLHFPERRRDDLVHGLSQVARERAIPDLARLYAELAAGGPAWEAVVQRLTIGETYFFRNDAQFAALRERILPDLLARRASARSLRLWSAGCATGEEPYSLAMTLLDCLPAEAGWQVGVLGTDLNPLFLERAREAVFGSWSFRETPEALRQRFFTPEGPRWRLRPEVRRMAMFSRLNLVEPAYPALANGTAAMDLIFCRNVLIYFDPPTIRAVIDRLYAALAPGGWLVVGHAEPNAAIFQSFETINAPGAVLYRKPANAPLFMAPAVATADREIKRQGDKERSALLLGAAPPPPSFAAPRSPALPASRSSALPAAPAPPAPDPLKQAHLAADRGDWPAAQALVERALLADPLCAAAHHLHAQIHEHTGDLEAALAAYRRSLYLEPERAMAAVGMADAWRQLSQPVEAARGYRVALRLLERPGASPGCGADGATAAELAAYARLQLALLGEV
jgi:chemotaxis protein methyltransferase CheR